MGANGLGQVINPSELDRKYSSLFPDGYSVNQHDQFRSMLYSDDSWSAGTNQPGEYIQIDLGSTRNITGVITQSRNCDQQPCNPDDPQRVTAFALHVSATETGPFVEVGNFSETGDPRALCEIYQLFLVVEARFVRFVVISWAGHVSMRAGIVVGSKISPSPPVGRLVL